MEEIALDRKKTLKLKPSAFKRAFAFLADFLIINWIVLWPFKGVLDELLPKAQSFSETLDILGATENAAAISIVMIAASFLSILYFVILEKKLAQTPGKMFFNLYVESQNKDLKYWQLFIRSIFLIPIFPFVLLWIVDPIFMFFSKDRQRLSEILSKTKVMEKVYI
ncbi:RDD family protein [Candidatus Woesearchaeota archaeon]|nr:RDD family protein [Candidatus Woesearchaeota archaeon]